MSQKFWIGDPETVSAVKRKNQCAKIRVVSVVLGFSFLLVLVGNSVAQEPLSDPDAAPPPIKVLSKEEKQALDAETEVRKHTSVALELMNKRLSNAESFNSAEHFEEMYRELGSFHALMDNALEFLTKKDTDSSKVLNNFKKLEIGLRTFQPRLETIRRDLSLRYEPYIRTLIRYIHEAREKAIAPMFGDTVVRDRPKS
ncbi:MAG: hypothetical protein ABI999_03995 [Acidobacteriota bacterium]